MCTDVACLQVGHHCSDDSRRQAYNSSSDFDADQEYLPNDGESPVVAKALKSLA